MQETTTLKNEWLLYYYNECNMIDSDRIQRGLDGDPLEAADYGEMCESLDSLSVECPQPSNEVVNRILAYAR
ncbi:MAG: hypothetical protein ACKOA1_11250 [Bacteroidota bacterium]